MPITFRNVQEEDCNLLFEWRNDEGVRKMSFNSNLILYKDHKDWFCDRIHSDFAQMFIVLLEGEPIGQIRIDIENENGIISFSIAHNYRGNGYGCRILTKILDVVKDKRIKRLIGKVQNYNIQSRKAFEKAGYKRLDKGKYTEYYREI